MPIDPTTLFVCTGKDCRKQKKTARLLVDGLDSKYTLREVRCQDVCSALVVGFVHSEKLVWAKKIKSKKDVSAVFKSLDCSKLPKRIKSKLVKKRAGRLKS